MDIDRELARHQAATLRAIESGRVELAERRLEAYISFAQAFLDAASKRGLSFSLETSRSISMMDWRTPSEIINHAWDGILAAVKSGNNELMVAAAYIPIRFMQMSVDNKDFLFYRKMSQVYPVILATSYAPNLALTRDLLVDRSWRSLRNFADFFLPRLTAKHDNDIREQFTSELVWRFGDLMKVAMDHSDAATFAMIGREFDPLFHNLEIRGLPEDIASAFEEFAGREKSLVWFGFGAWILRSFILKDMPREPGSPNLRLIDQGQIVAFFEVVSRKFQNIKQLAGVYGHALSRQHGLSDWKGWIADTLPERQVHSIDFEQWLTCFYVVMGLRLSKTGGPTAADIPVPFRDLEFQMNNIRENISKIKSNQEGWKDFIPQLATKPANETFDNSYWEYFFSANEVAVKEWTRLKEDNIIASPIDPQRVATFQEDCLKGWHESSWFVHVLLSAIHKVEKIAEADSSYLSVHELVPKDAFIASPYAIYAGIGRNYGGILGRDISNSFRSLIEDNATNVEGGTLGSSVGKAMNLVSSMAIERSAMAIIAVGGFDLERQFLATPGFSPRWTQSKPQFSFQEFVGDIGDVPVFFIYDRQTVQITVIDLARVGKLVVYTPSENKVGGLLIRITAIDEVEANRIIKNQPKFLLNSDGSGRAHDAVIRDLLLKVGVFVGVKMELEIEAPEAIKKISL